MEISISKVKTFKACRRLYQLRYLEGLIPVQNAEALEVGKAYHAYIDAFYKGEEVLDDFSKERAMFEAYKKYIAPQFQMKESEKRLQYEIEGDVLVGVADGIASDGRLVEHKTTSLDITEQYEYNLQWDEQILAYMLMTGSREVWYTVCRKPTIKQKQNESEEEFYHRMVAWYDEDTNSKIRVMLIQRTDEDIEHFRLELISMLDTMKYAESVKELYKNTCHCNLYGRRCEYSSICLHYDPSVNYIEFVKNK